MTSLIEVKNLRVVFGRQEILSGVSFVAKKGETIAIIGPNGSGKTTLFRAILGAIPYEGEIKLARGIRIGYVPQRIDFDRTIPITVREFWNLQSNTLRGHDTQNREAPYSLEELIHILRLPSSFFKKRLGELSAGELQKVLLGFALRQKPNLLLLDEPAAGVDIAGQENVYELLHTLQDLHQLALLLISHDLSVVYRYATRVLCLHHQQVCFGVPQEVLSKETLDQLYGKVKLYHHLPKV
jgi:zinc transport system ATP-binding protein